MNSIRILFLLVAVLASASLSATGSNLVVFSEGGERFTLHLNGKQQNAHPQSNVKVMDLTHANYKVRIVFEDIALGSINKNVFFDESASTERVFTIKQNKKGAYVLRMVSESPLVQTPTTQSHPETAPPPRYPQQPVPSSNTETVVTETSHSTVTTTTNQQGAGNDADAFSMNVKMGPDGVSMDVQVKEEGGVPVSVQQQVTTTTVSSSTTTTSQQTTTDADPITENPIPTSVEAPCGPMSSPEFDHAKGSISSKDFEDSKLTLAKQIARNNCLSAAQVRDIMLLFDFEDSRLDFAKAAYDQTADQGNYYQVNDAFDFESSISELDRFLQNKR